jgi:hypothetical protein
LFRIDTNINELLIQLPIHLKLKESIKTDISEFIRKDIEKNLVSGTGIDGTGLKAKKYGGRLFYDTGLLLQSVTKQIYQTGASVFIAPVRAQIASYINSGTNRMPQREFFGISQRVLPEIDRYLINKKFEDIFENRFK